MMGLRIYYLLALAFALCACQSYRITEIETCNPATITFPPDIKSVMIVNNAAQQPDNIGHKDFSGLDTDSILSVSADSMAYRFCLSLGKAIAESPLFDDVRIGEDALRRDSLFSISRPLTNDVVASLCEEHDVDALIILDKFYFNTTLFNSKNLFLNMSIINVAITGEVRMMYPDCPVAITVPIADSLIVKPYEHFYYEEPITFTSQDVKEAMAYLSEYIGNKMQKQFIPYWTDDKRWYYTNPSSAWKRATVYAVSQKWAAAADEWRPLYHSVSKWKHKARLASNLALCHEMTGDFQKAVEYAKIACTLFKEHTVEDDPYRKMQHDYLELLKKRLEDDQKLSEQLRENQSE